mmetsp:Transcript_24307/g.75962  ORF Transcript_24307/g.75962 Transcript_24307/m.75962 type:complete len:236 (-) Transcript_24307:79-786(-)
MDKVRLLSRPRRAPPLRLHRQVRERRSIRRLVLDRRLQATLDELLRVRRRCFPAPHRPRQAKRSSRLARLDEPALATAAFHVQPREVSPGLQLRRLFLQVARTHRAPPPRQGPLGRLRTLGLAAAAQRSPKEDPSQHHRRRHVRAQHRAPSRHLGRQEQVLLDTPTPRRGQTSLLARLRDVQRDQLLLPGRPRHRCRLGCASLRSDTLRGRPSVPAVLTRRAILLVLFVCPLPHL